MLVGLKTVDSTDSIGDKQSGSKNFPAINMAWILIAEIFSKQRCVTRGSTYLLYYEMGYEQVK